MDVHTKKQRSYNMSKIKSKDTKPEVKLRKTLFHMWLKWYRINYKIEWKPDIVFTKYKTAIFIDWCFWHKCPKCYKEPKSNKKFRTEKIEKNVKRDKTVNRNLRKKWRKVIRIREHEVRKNPEKAAQKIYYKLNVKSH